uniref:CTLH domain-containing protein n=1 Tax=Glossina pallidipes TaxID=7398 RepID=A0A1A9ZB80_GLOPL
MAASSSSAVEFETVNAMEKETELERIVVNKFTEISQNAANEIDDVARLLERLLRTLSEADQEMTNDHKLYVDFEIDIDDDDDIGQPMADDNDTDMQMEMQPPPVCTTGIQVAIITDTLEKFNAKLRHLWANCRDIHDCFSGAGKTIDCKFIVDFTTQVERFNALQVVKNTMLINNVNANHYYRQAVYNMPRLLIEKFKMPADIVREEVFGLRSSFAEIYRIWRAILQRDLKPALEWSNRHSNELKARNSSLEFELHRLAFLQIISRGMPVQTEAILYARNNFYKFVDHFEHEIPKLMGCFIYLPLGIENSPYKHLISADMWTKASCVFLKDACHTLGIRKNSDLSMIMQSRKVVNFWYYRNQLPVEMERAAIAAD